MRYFGMSIWGFAIFLRLSLLTGAGCESSGSGNGRKAPAKDTPKVEPAPKPSDPAPTPTPAPSPEPTPTPGPSSTDPRGAIEGCASQGKVWVFDEGNGACGDAVAKFCCTDAEIKSRFASSISGLADQLSLLNAMGLKLYACSSNGSNSTVFHYISTTSGGLNYQTFSIPKKSETGEPPADCPRYTSKALGIDQALSGASGNGNAGTSSSTGTKTNTETTP
jgi:hypothetical protein